MSDYYTQDSDAYFPFYLQKGLLNCYHILFLNVGDFYRLCIHPLISFAFIVLRSTDNTTIVLETSAVFSIDIMQEKKDERLNSVVINNANM